MHKIAVFASGRGTNFMAIHRYCQTDAPDCRIVCLVTDKPDCLAAKYAADQGIPIVQARYGTVDRAKVEADLLADLASYRPLLLVLAGFMRLLGKTLIDAYPKRIINIHPSLLPNFPGARAIAESIASTDRELGITIHYVDYGMDTGPIICQERFSRRGDESPAELEARLHELEHAAYPPTIIGLLQKIHRETGL